MTDSSSMFSVDHWDLAPGEGISQSQPIRAVRGERTLPCPAPTLDTEEFLAQSAYNEDCSSVDSLAEIGLVLGTVRSQSPLRTLHGSQLPQGPPPSLDRQEFEINNKSEEMWIVEDSLASEDLAPFECRSQGPVLDIPNSPDQFRPPSLDTQEFEKNRLIADDVWRVEDSLAGWDSAVGEVRLGGTRNHFNDLKSLGSPTDAKKQKAVSLSHSTTVNCVLEAGNSRKIGSTLVVAQSTSAAKRSWSPTSPGGDSGKSHKQNFGWGQLASSKHKLPGTFPPPISDIRPAVRNVVNVLYKISPATRFTLMDVANSRVSAPKSPTKSSFEKRSCLSKSHEVILANKAEYVTNPVVYPSNNRAVSKCPEVGHCMKGTEVDAKSRGLKPGSGGQAIAKLQHSSNFESATTSPKLGMQDDGLDTEGWLCPRDGKKFRPTSKQLLLDRWIR